MKKNMVIEPLIVIDLVLFEFAVLFPGKSFVFTLLIVFFNSVFTLINKKNVDFALLSSFVLGNEIMSISNFIIISTIGDKNKHNKIGKINTKVLIFLFVVIVNSFISAMINNTYINAIFSIIYISFLIFMVTNSSSYIDKDKLLENLKKLIILEFIVFVSILLKYRMLWPSDYNYGTLQNSHSFGIWISFALLALSGNKDFFKNIFKNFFYVIILLIMLYFTDAKAVELSMIVFVIIAPLVHFISKKKNDLIIFVLGTYIILYLIFPLFTIKPVQRIINSKAPTVYPYIYNLNYNYKFNYMHKTLYYELKNVKFFIGFGLGQYGSRFANLFAYDVMYRNDNTINNLVAKLFSPHHNKNYIQYVKFYDNAFVSQITWRSAILSYPFSSLISIIGELGVVGMILLAIFINKYFHNSKYKKMLYIFVIFCIFDNYLDMFAIAGYLMVLLSIKEECN